MWNVQRGHHLVERIEEDIRRALPNVIVFTHLESLSDPASWDDGVLDREQAPSVDASEAQPQQSQNGKTAQRQSES
jgi:hypothetical protein